MTDEQKAIFLISVVLTILVIVFITAQTELG